MRIARTWTCILCVLLSGLAIESLSAQTLEQLAGQMRQLVNAVNTLRAQVQELEQGDSTQQQRLQALQAALRALEERLLQETTLLRQRLAEQTETVQRNLESETDALRQQLADGDARLAGQTETVRRNFANETDALQQQLADRDARLAEQVSLLNREMEAFQEKLEALPPLIGTLRQEILALNQQQEQALRALAEQVSVLDERMVRLEIDDPWTEGIPLPIFYEPDQAILLPATRQQSLQSIETIAQLLYRNPHRSVRVTGHTARVRCEGSQEVNCFRLSKARAQLVVDILVEEHNIPKQRMQVVGCGWRDRIDLRTDNEALTSEERDEARAENRRVVLVLEREDTRPIPPLCEIVRQ